MQTKRIVISFIITIILVLFTILIVKGNDETENKADKLAYISNDNNLMLYDPNNRTEITLLEDVGSFLMSPDGRVAFTQLDETDTELYLFDPAEPNQDPIKISRDPFWSHYPISWSPDGQYLAFGSFIDRDDVFLYIWDGETVTDITPEDKLDSAEAYWVAWSSDNRLAIMVQHGWSSRDISPEIYLWDGNTTINLSQNPDGWDWGVSWSQDGQLMFGSERDDDQYSTYIWDGVSFKDSLPDIETLIEVAPELELESESWVDDSTLVLTIHEDDKQDIVLWNVKDEVIVDRFTVTSNIGNAVLADGESFILSHGLASGIPSFNLSIENIEGEILFREHVGEFSWSSTGYLAYCGIENGASRVLSVWNGEESWVVANVSYKPIQWQNGGDTLSYLRGEDTFSCNNG